MADNIKPGVNGHQTSQFLFTYYISKLGWEKWVCADTLTQG